MSGSSFTAGKIEACEFIREHFPPESSILDVGPGCGTWRDILPEYSNMDAVEIFPATAAEIQGKYRSVICADIADVEYEWYDLIIFGDVLEHMSVEDAQKMLEYARPRCEDMIIAVPFQYQQGECYGNPWERHIQDDLTLELFYERYPGFESIYLTDNYAYFHRSDEDGKRDQSL